MEESTDTFDILEPENIKALLLFCVNNNNDENNEKLKLLISFIKHKSNEDASYSHLLGNYYCHIKNDENMLKYFIQAVNKNYKPSIKTLIVHYANKNEFENMEINIDKIVDIINKEIKDSDNADKIKELNNEMLEIIRYAAYKYKQSEKLEEMALKLKICVDDFNDITSTSTLANYYRSIENYLEMEKYYLRGIYNNCSTCALNYGIYFYSIKNYEEMMRCYDIAIKHENKNAYFQLYLYYKDIEDETQISKYYNLIIENKELMDKYYEIDTINNILFRKQT
jgi:tetratricopeptide (TPR) repeat protein